MELSLINILTIGFILGIKHAIEPDHVIAVSTIASQTKKLWRSSLAGFFWGLGHTLTILIVGMILITLKGEIPVKWALSLEFLVGVMLVYLGISSIYTYKNKKIHAHKHKHEGGIFHNHFHQKEDGHIHIGKEKKFPYLKSTIIGFVHGIAGSAAMIILTMSTVKTSLEGIMYIVFFGIGTTIGMLLFTTLIGIPFVLSIKKTEINGFLTVTAGLVSTLFGIYYMYNLGITEDLFSMWLN